MTPIDFTIAIVNWNTRQLLETCLDSVALNGQGFQLQVLVADNASSDGSAEMVTARFPWVSLISNDRNLGFAAAHRQLFERSTGRFHILLNSDVSLLPGCLSAVAHRLESDSAIGVLGCQIRDETGRVQPSCRRFPTLGAMLIEASGLSRILPRHPHLNAYKMGDFDHQTAREVDQVMGAFFVIRRETLTRIGFLDSAFFMYFEEVDYCRRAHQAGFKVFFEAQAHVMHVGGGSANQVKVLTIRRTFRSMRHYFKKHFGAWTWAPLLGIVSLDLVTHTLHAIFTRCAPLTVLKAYALAVWDVMTVKRADG